MSTVPRPASDERSLETLLREKRMEILAIAERHGAVNVRLFGSVARGASRPDSDIDFLVDVREPVSAWFPASLIVELEDLLGCSVDVVPESRLAPLLRPAVLSSALALSQPLPEIAPTDPSVVVKDDRLYLDHILDAIDRVEEIASGGRETFLSSWLPQDAALRNLQTMAESTQKLSAGAKALHPDVDWARIARFRNVVTHGYLEVDLEKVWLIMREDMHTLKKAVTALRSP